MQRTYCPDSIGARDPMCKFLRKFHARRHNSTVTADAWRKPRMHRSKVGNARLEAGGPSRVTTP